MCIMQFLAEAAVNVLYGFVAVHTAASQVDVRRNAEKAFPVGI